MSANGIGKWAFTIADSCPVRLIDTVRMSFKNISIGNRVDSGNSGFIMAPSILRDRTSYQNQIHQDPFRMKTLLVLSGACLILSQNSFAETSSEYAACRDRAAGNAVQLDLCVEKELAVQDTRLNKVYGKLAHQYGSDQAKRKALKADELAWLKNRDEECQSGNGGVTLPDCELRKTDARADELESRLAN